MIFKSDDGKTFNQEQAIDLLVSLVATDANSEKKWRGFYNFLSSTELQGERDYYWKSWRSCKAQKTEVESHPLRSQLCSCLFQDAQNHCTGIG